MIEQIVSLFLIGFTLVAIIGASVFVFVIVGDLLFLSEDDDS